MFGMLRVQPFSKRPPNDTSGQRGRINLADVKYG